MRSRLARLAREPLVHFLLIGATLFLLWRLAGEAPPSSEGQIEVGEAEVESLIDSWSSVWQRPPSAAELRELVDEYVREEILFREAVALGLHRADPIIRRRLVQKMELLAEDVASIPDPSEADLTAFLERDPRRFEREARLSFAHVYLDPERRGGAVADAAADLLERLRSDPETSVASLGDPLALPRQVGLMRLSEIRRLFGGRFVDALTSLPVGVWSGPVESDLGVHLVRVGAREEARLPPFEEIRRAVESEWLADRQRRARDLRYEELRRGYDVEVVDLEALLARRGREGATSGEAGGGSGR
ncbi:MAG: peptidylprolyl isomerase [Thermoanaerobaculia bacterium]|nr:peptidylprolyl isomerase [Thermoanaerobaculia bacterium]